MTRDKDGEVDKVPGVTHNTDDLAKAIYDSSLSMDMKAAPLSPLDENTYYAHTPGVTGEWHKLVEHLRAVAERAKSFAEPFGAGELAYWVGVLHDIGKFNPDFQTYLKEAERARKENLIGPTRGPDHSSAGALEFWENSLAQPLAFVVAGHHGGLMDAEDLKERMTRKQKDPGIIQVRSYARSHDCGPPPQLAAVKELFGKTNQIQRASFFLRMLHSTIVDADCLDTEQHFEPEVAELRSIPYPSLEELWQLLQKDQQDLRASTTDTTAVNECRWQIYQSCLDAARQSPGFFNLTVPTGGGKTRSAMAFALQHALCHGMRRVIVVLPYTAIIEQNVDVYRAIFGTDAVLEHHSAVASREKPGVEDDHERRARLAAQNWDAPIIVTTMVQLFESLFAARNSRVRKLHNIVCSVIILDEAQSVPINLLSPTLLALRFLVQNFGCTIVLSSATQPALNQRIELPIGIDNAYEIVPNYADYFHRLARVRYELPRSTSDTWSWDMVASKIRDQHQVLVVLNTINDALTLIDHLPSRDLYHLSTNLCGAHRRQVLAEVRRRLDAGKPCRLITTQVIEAGVDIDFPVVMRALGPLDRIVQTAGRCNREGRMREGRVIVFQPEKGRMPPGSYKCGADTAIGILESTPALNLHDPDVYHRYFQLLYQAQNLDVKDISNKLQRLKFATVEKEYRLIEDDSVPVVVRYNPTKQEISADQSVDHLLALAQRAGRLTRELSRRLQPYLVNLRYWLFLEMQKAKLVSELIPDLYVWQGVYDDTIGLIRKGFRSGDLVI